MDANRYQLEAGVTLSGKFHGDKVTMAELRGRLFDGIRAANALDAVKKALFYGKGEDIGLTSSMKVSLATIAPVQMAGVCGDHDDIDAMTIVLHMILGKFTEAGELLEALIKAIEQGGGLDRVNLIEEVGDGLWYDANLLTALEASFGEAMGRNNAKLRLRFPDGFTEAEAINRNLNAEREVLAKPVKQSSAELSSLAGQVMAYTRPGEPMPDIAVLIRDARRLAGCVMGQDETPGQDIDPEAPGYDPDASRLAVGNSKA